MAKSKYNARWDGPSGASLANVDFEAASIAGVIKQVKSIGRQVGLMNTLCYVSTGGQKVLHKKPCDL